MVGLNPALKSINRSYPMPLSKLSPTPTINRRRFLHSVAGAAVVGAPALRSRSALASSGELNLLTWSDALSDGHLKAFKDQTGIALNITTIGSNEEIIDAMKRTGGESIDLICPTNTRAAQWQQLNLLQPFDLAKIAKIGTIQRELLQVGERDWNFDGRGTHWLPLFWGSEAMAWRNDMWQPDQSGPSYGDFWQPQLRGKVMIQPHSGMLGAGLHLEAIGRLSENAMLDAYRDEVSMRAAWDVVAKFCVARNDQIKLFWNDADTQRNALLNEGVVSGQCWDGPALALKSGGEPVSYQAPNEGALTWVDGLALSAKSRNLEQAYALLDFCFTTENAGAAIKHNGYNSSVVGAERFADKQFRQNFNDAYPGDALQELWIWPSEPSWYAKLRNEYRNKLVNA